MLLKNIVRQHKKRHIRFYSDHLDRNLNAGIDTQFLASQALCLNLPPLPFEFDFGFKFGRHP